MNNSQPCNLSSSVEDLPYTLVYKEAQRDWSREWFRLLLEHTQPWHWVNFGRNQNITWEIVEAYPNHPWNWYGLSENPNITWDIIIEHPDKLWSGKWIIIENTMKKGKEDFVRRRLQQWFSRSNLKEELMATVWHPRNLHRFKDLDPHTFGKIVLEEIED